MKIVIVGAKDRTAASDKKDVDTLIELAASTYPDCVIVTAFAYAGIGQFVKEKCLEKDEQNQFRFQLIECSLRTYTRSLTRIEYGEVCVAMNAMLFELGDCFYHFASTDRRGTLEELITDRLIQQNRPFRVFLPGDTITVI